MSSLIPYAVPMIMFGKYKRMQEYIKELEENIDELEFSLQELRLQLKNRDARYEWFIIMILFSLLALIAAVAAAFPYTTGALIGPLGLAGVFHNYHTQGMDQEDET